MRTSNLTSKQFSTQTNSGVSKQDIFITTWKKLVKMTITEEE
jgi:hypothetical protein